MFDRYEVGGLELTVHHWHAVPAERRRATDAERDALAATLRTDEGARQRLRRWLAEAGFELAHVDEVDALLDAARGGRVVLCARPVERPVVQVFDGESDADADATPPPAPEHDWIEIELTDEDDVPLPGVAFALTLPDGTVRPGITNDRGRFLVPRTDPGQCRLRWTRLHPVERAPRFVAALAAGLTDV